MKDIFIWAVAILMVATVFAGCCQPQRWSEDDPRKATPDTSQVTVVATIEIPVGAESK